MHAKFSRELRKIENLFVALPKPAKAPGSAFVFRIFLLFGIVFRGWQEPKQAKLPSLARMFLLFVSSRNREHIIGDLQEECRTTQKRFPRCWYWGQVFALVGCYWWAALRRIAERDTIRKMIRK
jgi:hypothetical protein